MARKRKPTEIKVGHAYRLNYPFGAGPGESVVLVTEIEQVTKTSRMVLVEWIENDCGWRADSYSSFLRSVHSEEPRHIH